MKALIVSLMIIIASPFNREADRPKRPKYNHKAQIWELKVE